MRRRTIENGWTYRSCPVVQKEKTTHISPEGYCRLSIHPFTVYPIYNTVSRAKNGIWLRQV